MSEAPFLLALEPSRIPARNARAVVATILLSLQRVSRIFWIDRANIHVC